MITVTDAAGATASRTASLTVNAPAPPPLVFVTNPTLPQGKVRSAYSTTLVATGGKPGYTFVLTSGKLPAGLSLSSSGVISGTPTKQGSATFIVRVTDSTGVSTTRSFTLQVKR